MYPKNENDNQELPITNARRNSEEHWDDMTSDNEMNDMEFVELKKLRVPRIDALPTHNAKSRRSKAVAYKHVSTPNNSNDDQSRLY